MVLRWGRRHACSRWLADGDGNLVVDGPHFAGSQPSPRPLQKIRCQVSLQMGIWGGDRNVRSRAALQVSSFETEALFTAAALPAGDPARGGGGGSSHRWSEKRHSTTSSSLALTPSPPPLSPSSLGWKPTSGDPPLLLVTSSRCPPP